jgi:hypothetical protein
MLCAVLKTTLFLLDCFSGLSCPHLFTCSSCAYLHRSIN